MEWLGASFPWGATTIEGPIKMAEPMRARSLFQWLAAGHFANDCGPGAIWLVAPAAALAFGYGPAEVGLLIAISSIGAALAYVPSGILADRVSHQGRLLWLSFIWVAVGYGVASFADSFWVLAFMLAFAGLGDAAWHPVATGVLVRARPDRKAEALGLHAIGGTLSEVAAPLAVGFLIAAYDWRVALACAAIPSAIMAIAFLRVRDKIPHATATRISKADVGSMARLWLKPTGLKLIGTISIYNMANIGILAMMPLMLRDSHDFGPADAGIAFAAITLLGALAQPAIGKLSDRVNRKPVVVIGNLAGCLGALLVWQSSDSLWLSLLGLCIAAIALHGIRSVVLAAAVDYAKERAATTLGFAFMIMDGIGALGAWASGIAGAIDIHNAFLACAVLSAMSAFGAWRMVFAKHDPVLPELSGSTAPEQPH